MKIAYITVQLPYGPKESFIIPEIREVQDQGNEVLVLPFRPGKSIFHKEAEFLGRNSIVTHLFSIGVLRAFVAELARQPLKAADVVAKILRKSRNTKVLFKNLIAVPRGFYFASIIRKKRIEHIHAHWASTPSTAAYIASFLSDVSWSFTAHRWDILENNLLTEKCQSASFVRAISETGKEEIMQIIKDESITHKVDVIHMGVEMPEPQADMSAPPDIFTFLCPANFVDVKGHRYLIEACRMLNQSGVAFKCLLAGDGPLEDELKKYVKDLNLSDSVQFLGRLPHERILAIYEGREVHAVILPSIETTDGQKEGIPVALMEAMAYGIPVISTATGGIPELLGRAGIVLPGGNAEILAKGIIRLMKDDSYLDTLRKLGREKVLQDFNLCINVGRLLDRMKGE